MESQPGQWIVPCRQRERDTLPLQPVRLEDGGNHLNRRPPVTRAAQRLAVFANRCEQVAPADEVRHD